MRFSSNEDPAEETWLKNTVWKYVKNCKVPILAQFKSQILTFANAKTNTVPDDIRLKWIRARLMNFCNACHLNVSWISKSPFESHFCVYLLLHIWKDLKCFFRKFGTGFIFRQDSVYLITYLLSISFLTFISFLLFSAIFRLHAVPADSFYFEHSLLYISTFTDLVSSAAVLNIFSFYCRFYNQLQFGRNIILFLPRCCN